MTVLTPGKSYHVYECISQLDRTSNGARFGPVSRPGRCAGWSGVDLCLVFWPYIATQSSLYHIITLVQLCIDFCQSIVANHAKYFGPALLLSRVVFLKSIITWYCTGYGHRVCSAPTPVLAWHFGNRGLGSALPPCLSPLLVDFCFTRTGRFLLVRIKKQTATHVGRNIGIPNLNIKEVPWTLFDCWLYYYGKPKVNRFTINRGQHSSTTQPTTTVVSIVGVVLLAENTCMITV